MNKIFSECRSLLMCIAIFCIAMVGIAVFLQQTQDMLPCPLCVIQRYIFLGIALVCLLGVAMGLPKLGAFVSLLGAFGGLAVVGKHLYILAHPGLSCGIDPVQTELNKIVTAEYLPWLFKADGRCEDTLTVLYGLTIPQWSGVAFVMVTLGLLWAMTRRR